MRPFDKNGIELNVGDWVRYPWWDGTEYRYYSGMIREIHEDSPGEVWVQKSGGTSTARYCMKLPVDPVEREGVLFLMALSEPTSKKYLNDEDGYR